MPDDSNPYHNPYPGINAHLNSLLQTPGNEDQAAIWPGFHSQHITDIVEALNTQLPRHYFAIGEQSLQVRSASSDFGVQYPRPDVSIYQRHEANSAPNNTTAPAPTWEASLADILEPLKQPRAVIIRELVGKKLGQIVTRIELLSPANKPNGSHYDVYAVKRIEAIEDGVPLVEIDYLHESPSVVSQLPPYPEHLDAYAYNLIVSDPRPNWSEGKIRAYSFGAGEPISLFPIPLSGNETLDFDLNPVYQHSFVAGRWNDLLDYRVAPERFSTYSQDDQKRIRDIMAKAST